MRPTLGKGHVKKIGEAVDSVYTKLLDKLLGGAYSGKQIRFTVKKPPTSLPGLFQATGHAEGVKTDPALLDPVLEIAKGYIEANRERTKAKVLNAIQAFLNEAHAEGHSPDFEDVLTGQLHEVFGEAKRHVRTIVQTEATNVQNTGLLDTIIKVNALNNVEDPVIYFICVHDDNLCVECARLHLLPDGITPRVWKHTECGHGYHTKGDNEPKIGGLHPNDRCVLATVLPGYGFENGRITYVGPDHDEFAEQRKKFPPPSEQQPELTAEE